MYIYIYMYVCVCIYIYIESSSIYMAEKLEYRHMMICELSFARFRGWRMVIFRFSGFHCTCAAPPLYYPAKLPA